MRRIVIRLCTLALVTASAFAQTRVNPHTQVNWPGVTGSGAPTIACTTSNYGEPYTDTLNNVAYRCMGSGWQQVAIGSFLSISGGVLTGAVTSPQVNGLYEASGYPVSGCTVNAIFYPRQIDCAIQTLLNVSSVSLLVPVLHIGPQQYLTDYGEQCVDQKCVSVVADGQGYGNGSNSQSSVVASSSFPTGTPVFSHTVTSGNGCNGTTSGCLGLWHLRGFTIDGSGRASSCMDGTNIKVSTFEHMQCQGITASGASHAWENGGQDGSFQDMVDDLFILGSGNGPSSWASVSASGSPLTYTVSSAGSYKNANPPVKIKGTGCTGTATAVMSGTGPYTLSNITGTVTGCTGSVYVSVPDLPPTQYGFVNNATDSTIKDVVGELIGQTAGLQNIGSDVHFIHPHFWESPTLYVDYGAARWDHVVFDSAIFYGFDFESPANVDSSVSTWNASYPGSGDFYFGSNTIGARVGPHTCGQYDRTYQTAGGYSLFTTANGPLVIGQSSPNFPGGVRVEFATECGGTYQTVNQQGGIQSLTGNIVLNYLNTPSVTVTPNVTGSTTYTYAVVAKTWDNQTSAAGTATITNGAASPNNTISGFYVANAVSYDIYCTAGCATTGKLNTSPVFATSYTDTTGSGNGATVPGSTAGRIQWGSSSGLYLGPCTSSFSVLCLTNSTAGSVYWGIDNSGVTTFPASNQVASASTIALTKKLTRITGTTPIQTITGETVCGIAGGCEQTLIFQSAGASLITGGNIVSGTAGATVYGPTQTANQAVTLWYDTATSLWYMTGSATPPKHVSLDYFGTFSAAANFSITPTFPSSATITGVTVSTSTVPAGCTTYPVVVLYACNGTYPGTCGGTTVGSVTLSSSTAYNVMTISSSAIAAGNWLMGRVNTAAAGCTTNANGVDVVVQYY